MVRCGDRLLGKGIHCKLGRHPGVVASENGGLFAHWLEALGEGHAYGVQIARSDDKGRSWTREGWLHDDTSAQEHGFVSYVPLPDGVQAFWLDGRERVEPDGSTGLRTAVLGEASGTPTSTLLDGRVCECCSTDAALGASGPKVVYRDRSDDEIRDISLLRKTSSGWSQPISVHRDSWKINGCPVNGPAVAASGHQVAVSWFTAASRQAMVKVAVSQDEGLPFALPIVVDDYKPVGRVDIAVGNDDRIWVLWVAQGGVIRLRELSLTGNMLSTRMVAQGGSARASGSPKLVRQGSGVLVVWKGETTIEVATFPSREGAP